MVFVFTFEIFEAKIFTNERKKRLQLNFIVLFVDDDDGEIYFDKVYLAFFKALAEAAKLRILDEYT